MDPMLITFIVISLGLGMTCWGLVIHHINNQQLIENAENKATNYDNSNKLLIEDTRRLREQVQLATKINIEMGEAQHLPRLKLEAIGVVLACDDVLRLSLIINPDYDLAVAKEKGIEVARQEKRESYRGGTSW